MRNRQKDRSYMEHGLVAAHDDGDPPLKVVPDALCSRCGVCDAICPTDVIRFDDRAFPFIQTEGCIACGLCVAVCPGVEFDYKAAYLAQFGDANPSFGLAGTFRSAWLCASPDADTRLAGSGGGVVTQILIGLLKQGVIDGALTVGQDPDNPLWPAPRVCRTEEELRATAGSKYCVVPHAKVLRDVRRMQGRFAFVGIGCQVEGLRNLERFNKRLGRRKLFTIGLACHGTLERDATADLLRHRGVPSRDVVRFHYRGGQFPGKFQAELGDRSRRNMHRFEYKDAAYNYLFRLYTPQRCLDCPDFSAEFSDVSVADYWVRGKDGEYLHPEGSSLVLCRTERGEVAVMQLLADRHLVGEPLQPEDVDRAFSPVYREKRISPFVRAQRVRKRQLRVPDYNLPKPRITTRDRWMEGFQRLTFMFSHSRFSQRLMIRLLFSPVGEMLTFLNITRKKWLGRRRSRRQRA